MKKHKNDEQPKNSHLFYTGGIMLLVPIAILAILMIYLVIGHL